VNENQQNRKLISENRN